MSQHNFVKSKNCSRHLLSQGSEIAWPLAFAFRTYNSNHNLSMVTLQIPSIQTSWTRGLLLHGVPSLTLPRGDTNLPLRHDSKQGSGTEKYFYQQIGLQKKTVSSLSRAWNCRKSLFPANYNNRIGRLNSSARIVRMPYHSVSKWRFRSGHRF